MDVTTARPVRDVAAASLAAIPETVAEEDHVCSDCAPPAATQGGGASPKMDDGDGSEATSGSLVALSMGKSNKMHGVATDPTSIQPATQHQSGSETRSPPPDHPKPQKQHVHHIPAPQTFYNARLNPIRNNLQPSRTYHAGVFKGVPIISTESQQQRQRQNEPVLRKQPVRKRQPANNQDNATAATATAVATRPATSSDRSPVGLSMPQGKADRPATSLGIATPVESKHSYPESVPPKTTPQQPAPDIPEYSADALQRPATSTGQIQASAQPQRVRTQKKQASKRPQTAMQRAHGNKYKEWRDIHVQSLSRVDSILREAVGLGSRPIQRSASTRAAVGTPPLPQTASGLGISIPPNATDPVQGRRILHPHQPLTLDTARRPTTAASSSSSMSLNLPNSAFTSAANAASLSMDPTQSRPSTSHTYSVSPSALSSRPGTGRSFSGSLFNPPAQYTTVPLTRSYTASAVGRPSNNHTTNAPRRLMSLYNAQSSRQYQLSRDEARRSRLFAEYENLIQNEEYEDDDGDDGEEFHTAKEDKHFVFGDEDERDNTNADRSKGEDNKEQVPGSDSTALDPHATDSAAARGLRRRPATMRQRSSHMPRHLRDTRAASAVYSPSPAAAGVFAKETTEKRWSRLIQENQHLFSSDIISSQLDKDDDKKMCDTHRSTAGEEAAFWVKEGDPEHPPVLDSPPTANPHDDGKLVFAEALAPLPNSAASTVSTATASTAASPHSPAAPSSTSSTTPSPSPRTDAAVVDASDSKPDATESKHATEDNGDAAESTSGSGSGRPDSIHIDTKDLFANTLFADTTDDEGEVGTGHRASSLHENDAAGVEASMVGELSAFDFGQTFSTQLDDLVASPLSAIPEFHEKEVEEEEEEEESQYTHADQPSATTLELQSRRSEEIRRQLRYVEALVPATELGTVLAKGDSEHKDLLDAYMRRFDFHQQPIDFALRQLFQQLHLPKESQQIDRVITSFAECYDACNTGLFYSSDVVYSYTFAILLLHTDAHNPKVRQKITKAQFISRAKLLDEHASEANSRAPSLSGDGEMFDEVLDILYDNITVAKFEYAPAATDGLDDHVAATIMTRPNTSHAELSHGAAHNRRASPEAIDLISRDGQGSGGISGWLKRMFAPAPPSIPPGKPVVSSQDIPSKEQFSYTVTPKRSPPFNAPAESTAFTSSTLPLARPNTAQATIYARRGGSSPQSPRLPDIAPHLAAGGHHTPAPSPRTPVSPAGSMFLPPIDAQIGSPLGSRASGSPDWMLNEAPAASAGGHPVQSPTAAQEKRSPEPRPPLTAGVFASQEFGHHTPEPSSPHGQGGSPHLAASSSFTTNDIAAPARPLMVESIRLNGVRHHVKRRTSLRQGRPLSGIIYESQLPQVIGQQQGSQSPGSPHRPSHLGSSPLAQHSSALPGPCGILSNGGSPGGSGKAFLRVDMAGRVSRKMERLDNGRRGLVRRWKEIWMVLSGSRLYFFRINDAAHSEHQAAPNAAAFRQAMSPGSASSKSPMSIQTIIPLRHGVAVVDSAYNKYPHVFRILAGDQSQILIKAPSDDAVAEWMARINCAAAFKTMEVDRRVLDDSAPAPGGDRVLRLESRLNTLDKRLATIDDKLERSLRLFKQLATLAPLTRQARGRIVQYAQAAKERLKELYLVEQRLTCYKDVLELDLVIEYELASHHVLDPEETHGDYEHL
ncbi:hypothetical protein GQ54DRAFT_307826 [Martensiomyces pterosporus]|nr:hypothetical protein GQ54DRAFT_307826 [Martensiomyces pterosporus]